MQADSVPLRIPLCLLQDILTAFGLRLQQSKDGTCLRGPCCLQGVSSVQANSLVSQVQT